MAFTATAAQQDGWENPARYLAFVPPVEVASERLRRELDSVAKPSETPLEPVAVGSATSLLAATFSF